MQHLKDIHMGSLIRQRVIECELDILRICNFLKCDEKAIDEMYVSSSLDCDLLLQWSKLLEYDFFRIYSQHLIFYAPQASFKNNTSTSANTALPQFRKNIYTKEMIDFIIDLIQTNRKTKIQVIREYKIPKTTLYKWMNKYNLSENFEKVNS
ncbi:transposase [Chryseobacterium sp. JUb7]|uniref:transposase n=1 Tax=Chryseobacterium sp. JUb7 TaxID=2940599 RepID=UPI00216A4354|nr:transposase [Chryseobacterium sp. JUb7]MCS3530275.1 DNA-binding NtrC family response regulator [Chryseobacterium sp. JUb7]